MSRKHLLFILSVSYFFIFFTRPAYCQEAKKTNPFLKFFKSIDYTSRISTEYDTNIFLKENDEDSDLKQIFTQTAVYRLPKENHYFQMGYTGNYTYYHEEATGILGQSANVVYSYRPFNGFSIGIRDDYNWLQDSNISTTLGDQVLALGYKQNTPSAQIKYEINPHYTLITDMLYQKLDVRDGDNDDYIDNERLGVRGLLEYNFTPEKNLAAFAGFSRRQIAFPQISEKSSVSQRTFTGLTEKIPALLLVSQEVGFENIDMDDENNASDNNIDIKVSVETIFSLYTKISASLNYNARNPSLRRQYTQYGAKVASFGISHVLNPKASVFLDYSHERQSFDSNDVTAGQLQEDQKTAINTVKGGISRKLKNWLTSDFSYEYTNRVSDFANESYTDHLFGVSLTAKY